MAKRSTTTTTTEAPVTEATTTEAVTTEAPVTTEAVTDPLALTEADKPNLILETVTEATTEAPVTTEATTEAPVTVGGTALSTGTVTVDGTAGAPSIDLTTVDDSTMEAMVLAFLARKEAQAKAEAEAKAKAIVDAKAKVDALRAELTELETEYKGVIGAKRTELESAIATLQTLAPVPVQSVPAGKRGRAQALDASASTRVVARSADNNLGLTGTKLTLYSLMVQPDGMSEEEGCDALGWEKCGATVSKILREAQRAGLAISKATDPMDGRLRYRIHTV